MALIKSISWKGNYIAEYWTITKITGDKQSNFTIVELGLFENKEVYENIDLGIINEHKVFSQTIQVEGFDLQRQDIYPLLKTSKIVTKIVTPKVEAVLDKEGNIISKAAEEITEEVETNILTDAIDDL